MITRAEGKLGIHGICTVVEELGCFSLPFQRIFFFLFIAVEVISFISCVEIEPTQLAPADLGFCEPEKHA